MCVRHECKDYYLPIFYESSGCVMIRESFPYSSDGKDLIKNNTLQRTPIYFS